MKRTLALQAFCVLAGMTGFQSYGSLIATGQNPGSPFYADFTAKNLSLAYTYNSANAYGKFVITATTGAYTSSSDSPGTSAANNGTGYASEPLVNPTGPTGNAESFALTVYIKNYGTTGSPNWGVDNSTADGSGSSTLAVYGSLGGEPGFTGGVSGVTGGGASDLLLSANLQTGVGTFGFNSTGKEFDFLFTTLGGAPAIVADFLGVNNGKGAVRVTLPSDPIFNSSFTSGFSASGGQADSFVPEPAAYPLGAGAAALFGFAFIRQKRAGMDGLVY